MAVLSKTAMNIRTIPVATSSAEQNLILCCIPYSQMPYGSKQASAVYRMEATELCTEFQAALQEFVDVITEGEYAEFMAEYMVRKLS